MTLPRTIGSLKGVGRRKVSNSRSVNIAGKVKGKQHGCGRYNTIGFYGGWGARVPHVNHRPQGLIINKPSVPVVTKQELIAAILKFGVK